MPKPRLSYTPHGPSFYTFIPPVDDRPRAYVTTSYEEWGWVRSWEELGPLEQKEAEKDLEDLHDARCALKSLRPNWQQQALKLLQFEGFGTDFGTEPSVYPRERPELAHPRKRAIVIGWAIVESGYRLGEYHKPRDENPALKAFEELGI